MARSLRVGLLAILTSCAVSQNAAPTCELWDAFTDDFEQGIPKVVSGVYFDPMLEEARRSGYEELPDLITRFEMAFLLQDPEQEASPELTEAGRAIQRFCETHGIQSSPVSPDTSQSPDQPEAQSSDLPTVAARIEERAMNIIARRDLPYVVTQAEFEEADELEASQVNLPGGTWLIMEMEDPAVTGADSNLDTANLILYKPMEIFRDSLAPFEDELEFVSYYLLAFDDPLQTTFEVPPDVLLDYIAGAITNEEMADRIRISQLD